MEVIGLILYGMLTFTAGGAVDQTVPAVHDFNKKYIVDAIHSDGPVNEGINDGVEKR